MPTPEALTSHSALADQQVLWRGASSAADCCSTVFTGTKRIDGPFDRLADRLGVGQIVLVALDVGLHHIAVA